MGLDRLLGTWDITMRHVAMAEPIAGRQQYERVLDGAFVMLRWTYDHPDFPDAIALIDESSFHHFDVRGVARVFDLELGVGGLAMVRRDPDFWQRSSISFVNPDAMTGTGEMSHDGGATWEPDFSMTYSRDRFSRGGSVST